MPPDHRPPSRAGIPIAQFPALAPVPQRVPGRHGPSGYCSGCPCRRREPCWAGNVPILGVRPLLLFAGARRIVRRGVGDGLGVALRQAAEDVEVHQPNGQNRHADELRDGQTGAGLYRPPVAGQG